jgi:hypothetical protein
VANRPPELGLRLRAPDSTSAGVAADPGTHPRNVSVQRWQTVPSGSGSQVIRASTAAAETDASEAKNRP